MYRIIITNLENGKTIEKTGSFVTAQIRAGKGVYIELLGKASPMDVFEQCMSMDTVRDTLLKNCEKAKMMYALKDVVPHEEYVVDLDQLRR